MGLPFAFTQGTPDAASEPLILAVGFAACGLKA